MFAPKKEKPPTYRMEPDLRIPLWTMKPMLKGILEEKMKEHEYQAMKTRATTLLLSSVIRDKIKEQLCLVCPRYKFVVHVLIAQQDPEENSTSFQFSSRALTSEAFDDYMEESYHGRTFTCNATVWACYTD